MTHPTGFDLSFYIIESIFLSNEARLSQFIGKRNQSVLTLQARVLITFSRGEMIDH